MLGTPSTAWFDILSTALDGAEDEIGVEKSKNIINLLIEQEINNGIDASKIILAGHSLGGAQALYTALTIQHKLGGLIALETWLPIRTKFPGAAVVANNDVPVLQAHGDADLVVPFTYGTQTSAFLSAFYGANYVWRCYDGLGHTFNQALLRDVGIFLNMPTNSGLTDDKCDSQP